MSLRHDLPAGVLEWISDVGQGEVVTLQRHVARREAWVVDVQRADGSVLEGFLRIEREPQANNPWSLHKETQIVSALRGTTVPVPAVFGWNDQLSCALFERVRGRSDLDRVEDPATQRAVYEDFIDIVANLHTLDLDQIDLPVMPRPTSSRDCALGEMELIQAHWRDFLAGYREPLLTFGVKWLEHHVPPQVERISLVQGDTGPVNFMFDNREVTAVIDWEWGHLGDPMEDLGNICVRELWNPSGGLKGLFARYEEASHLHVDLDSVRYYRVQQQVRGMVPIHAITVQAHPQEPIAWYLAYRYVGDRSTCEAIALAMGVVADRPDFPDDLVDPDILARAAQYALDHDIAPNLRDPLAISRAKDVAILIACLDRQRQLGGVIDEIERDELNALLGHRPATGQQGLDELDAAIREGRLPDDDVLRYLTRRSYRLEWLWSPACSLYPDRVWAAID